MKPTQIFKQTCETCKTSTHVFFIPAEGSSEFLVPPCDDCGNFLKLEEAHPENIPAELTSWHFEANGVAK